MLQFITNPSDRYSIVEEVKMVVEGGCKWVQLRMKDASYDELKSTAEEIIPICRDAGVILVIDDNVALVKELRVHGVHLGKEDMDPRKAREILGPHAIIGVTANTSDDIMSMRGIDVDYVGLGPFRYTSTKKKLAPVLGLEGYRSIMDYVKEQGNKLPVVAIGGITIDDVDSIMSTGVQGIAMSGAIINAADPKEYVGNVLARLGIK
ncbi:MAG: thiamine phosphate synthase [Muribaculum sp.]|nr:thiamine phosphate synthase [Muribaculum sp.]